MFIFWIYLGIALVAGIILLILALTGGIFGGDMDLDLDVDAPGLDFEAPGTPSPMGLPMMLFCVTMVGIIGAIFSYVGFNWLTTMVMAVGGSLLFTSIAFLIMWKIFDMTTVTAHESLYKFKGKTGVVTIPIQNGKEGQVAFSSKKSGRMTVGATAKKNIDNDTVVVVKEVLGDIVMVAPRDDTRGKSKRRGKK